MKLISTNLYSSHLILGRGLLKLIFTAEELTKNNKTKTKTRGFKLSRMEGMSALVQELTHSLTRQGK